MAFQAIKLSEAQLKVQSEDWKVRLIAIQSFTELPQDTVATQAGEKLAKLATSDDDAEVRAAASKCIQGLGTDDAWKKHFATLLAEGLNHEWRHVRAQSAGALALFGPAAGEHAGALAALLADKSSVVRRAAAGTLGHLDSFGMEHLELLAAALQDRESEVRRCAVRGIGTLGPAAAEHVDEVAALLRDVSPYVRMDAATALSSFGEEGMRHDEWLLALVLKDDNADVRTAAAAALGRLGRNSANGFCVDHLAAALREEDPQIRLRAAQALQAQGSASGTQSFSAAESLGDGEEEVRQNVAFLFEVMDDEAAARCAAQLAETILQDESIPVQYAAGRALATIPNAGLPYLDRFLEALTAEAMQVRLGAVLGLRALGLAVAPHALHLAERLLDDSWYVRRAAAEALGSLGPVAAPFIEELLRRALKDSDEDVRTAAVQAFMAQGSESVAVNHIDQIAELASPAEIKIPVRCAAGRCLGAFGEKSDKHLDKLRSMMRAREAELRLAAAQAYGGLPRHLLEDEDRSLLEMCVLREHNEPVKQAARQSLELLDGAVN